MGFSSSRCLCTCGELGGDGRALLGPFLCKDPQRVFRGGLEVGQCVLHRVPGHRAGNFWHYTGNRDTAAVTPPCLGHQWAWPAGHTPPNPEAVSSPAEKHVWFLRWLTLLSLSWALTSYTEDLPMVTECFQAPDQRAEERGVRRLLGQCCTGSS